MKNAPYQKLHLYVRACASASIEYDIAEIYCIVYGLYHMEMPKTKISTMCPIKASIQV